MHPLTGFWYDPAYPDGFRSISVSLKNYIMINGRDYKIGALWFARGKVDDLGKIEADFTTYDSSLGKITGVFDAESRNRISWNNNT